MSLAPHDQRTLTEIENRLRASDPKFADMLHSWSMKGTWRWRLARCVSNWWHGQIQSGPQAG